MRMLGLRFNYGLTCSGRGNMSEEFLTIMADLDDESQQILGGWYDKLRSAGFVGAQTRG